MVRSGARWRALVGDLSVRCSGCHRCRGRLAFVLLPFVSSAHCGPAAPPGADRETIRDLVSFRDSYERVLGCRWRGNPFSIRSYGSLHAAFERIPRQFGSATEPKSASAREHHSGLFIWARTLEV